MDDDVPPSVEFLGGAAAAGPEEVLPEPAPNRGRAVLLALLGVALLVAVVAVAIAGRGDDGGPAAAGQSVPVSRPTAFRSSAPVPVLTAGDAGPDPTPLTGRPAHAQCSLGRHAPAETLAAIGAAFPAAVIRTATTVLANRVGHFEPDLLRRELVAQDGSRTIRVCIRGGPPPADVNGNGRARADSDARVTVQRDGYRISVVVSGPGATTVLSRVAGLAGDPRLTAPL